MKIVVAPLAGARIEIYNHFELIDEKVSLPSRERGLKLFAPGCKEAYYLSLPSRERGLKLSYG